MPTKGPWKYYCETCLHKMRKVEASFGSDKVLRIHESDIHTRTVDLSACSQHPKEGTVCKKCAAKFRNQAGANTFRAGDP